MFSLFVAACGILWPRTAVAHWNTTTFTRSRRCGVSPFARFAVVLVPLIQSISVRHVGNQTTSFDRGIPTTANLIYVGCSESWVVIVDNCCLGQKYLENSYRLTPRSSTPTRRVCRTLARPGSTWLFFAHTFLLLHPGYHPGSWGVPYRLL